MKIAVFVSGRGSNLKALLDNVPLAKINVTAVVSDKLDCAAFNIAKEFGIDTFSVSGILKENYISYLQLIEKLKAADVELIVLAGFLKKIPDEFIDAFHNRIINIHPALLPLYGGKGMYGLNVHSAVFDAGAKVSGATVHLVDKVYDNGLIIAQHNVDIADADSPEEIARRVLKIEHQLLPFVVEKFADGKIIIENNKIEILD
jgi:phosphoribosylglycinamide formyltransferase 1